MSASSSVFALLVGINQFPGEPQRALRCAVSDAQSIRDFLLTKLNVPSANIRLLLDKEQGIEATHSNIISMFRSHLINNPAIRKGEDPMLFYFAGHGTSYGDGEYEAICPVDREEEGGGDIEDWRIGELLDELATEKGNNIVVVMDCCNSGSGTRVGSSLLPSHFRPRWAPPLKSSAFAKSSRSPGTKRVLRPDPNADVLYLSSHVLLAACRQDELAYEACGIGGIFTTILLRILSHKNITRTTYVSLLSEVQKRVAKVVACKNVTVPQTPQCEGLHKQRILFDSQMMGVDHRLVPIILDTMCVDAGAIHGVVIGTEFIIQQDQIYGSHDVVGRVVATEVHSVKSVVAVVNGNTLASSSSPCAFAMVTFWANYSKPYKVHVRDSPERPDLVRQMIERLEMQSSASRGDVNICIVHDDHSPDLVVRVYNDHCIFERMDGLAQANGLLNLRLPLLGLEDCLDRLSMAARFHSHLSRENTAHPYQNQISISLARGEPYGLPTKPQDLVTNGRVTLINDPNANYIFTVKNNSSTDLWCTLLHFDPATYTIQKLYMPTSPSMPPPLRRERSFNIGHRNSGVPPLWFTMETDCLHDRDIGFLKLFVSEEYADLSMLEQVSGFQHQEPSRRSRDGPSTDDSVKEGWDVFVVVVDVRKG